MAYLVKATDDYNKLNEATHSRAQTGESTVDHLPGKVFLFLRTGEQSHKTDQDWILM